MIEEYDHVHVRPEGCSQPTDVQFLIPCAPNFPRSSITSNGICTMDVLCGAQCTNIAH